MSDEIELTIDTTSLLGGAAGAFIATLWSIAPVFLDPQTAVIFASNETLLVGLGIAVTGGSLLHAASFNDGITLAKTSLYSGLTAFLLIGALGYAAIPLSTALHGPGTPTGQLTGDDLRIVTLDVDGMVCQGCRFTVKNYLESMSGAKKVTVSLPTKQATVIYDATKISAQELANSNVFQGAYSATVKTDKQYRG